ncbi:membrane associated protein [Streptococcus pneumoniae]|nr:membrane associated protein [Streptococcus pneumoniae]
MVFRFGVNNWGKRSAVLGLRRDKSGVFKPVTLHFTSAKKYAKVRKTDVKEMKWL